MSTLHIEKRTIERAGRFVATAEIFEDDMTVARRPNADPVREATTYMVSTWPRPTKEWAEQDRDREIPLIVRQYEKDRGGEIKGDADFV